MWTLLGTNGVFNFNLFLSQHLRVITSKVILLNYSQLLENTTHLSMIYNLF